MSVKQKTITLENIVYSVFPPEDIREYVIRTCEREWDPEDFPFFGDDLYSSTWKLEEIEIDKIKPNPELLSRPDFQADLKPRIEKLVEILDDRHQISPLILRSSDNWIFDGYARYHVLQQRGIKMCLAYVGSKEH